MLGVVEGFEVEMADEGASVPCEGFIRRCVVLLTTRCPPRCAVQAVCAENE